MLRTVILSATIQASIQSNPVCDNTKQLYQDMSCCSGEGSAVCKAPTLDLEKMEMTMAHLATGNLAEKAVREYLPVTKKLKVNEADVHLSGDRVVAATSGTSNCELNLPLYAELMNPDISDGNIFNAPSDRYNNPYFQGCGGGSCAGKMSNGQLYSTKVETLNVPTPNVYRGTYHYKVDIFKGLKWSDGVEITADDFVWCFNWFVRFFPDEYDKGRIFRSRDVDRMLKVDKHTFTIVTSKSVDQGLWEEILALCCTLPAHYWEAYIQKHGLAKMLLTDGSEQPKGADTAYYVGVRKPLWSNYTAKTLSEGPTLEYWPVNSKYSSPLKTFEYSLTKKGGKLQGYFPYFPYDRVQWSEGDVSGTDVIMQRSGAFWKKVNWIPCFNTEAYMNNPQYCWKMLMDGKLDVVNSEFAPNRLPGVLKSNFHVEEAISPGVRYIGFDTKSGNNGVFADLAFRQAIAMMIDRDGLKIELEKKGSVHMLNEAVSQFDAEYALSLETLSSEVPHIVAGNGKTLEQRKEAAVAHLKSHGFTHDSSGHLVGPDGVKVSKIYGMSPNADPLRMLLMETLVEAVTHLGVTAEHKPMSFNEVGCTNIWYAAYADACAPLIFKPTDGVTGLYTLGWGLGRVDDALQMASNAWGNSYNWSGEKKDKYEALLANYLSETDVSAKKQLAKDVYKTFLSASIHIDVFTNMQVQYFNKKYVYPAKKSGEERFENDIYPDASCY